MMYILQALANKLVLLGESEMKDNLWAAFASPDRYAREGEREGGREGGKEGKRAADT